MTERILSCYDMTHEFPPASSGGDSIRAGAGIGITATGDTVPADHENSIATLGRAAYVTARGNWQAEQGIFCWANSSGNTLTAPGQLAYWETDEIVGSDDGDNFAGVVYRVDERGVWVLSRFDLNEADAPTPPSTPTLAQVLAAGADADGIVITNLGQG